MKEESDYNMTLWLHDNFYNPNKYEFIVNLFFGEEGVVTAIIGNQGYSDADLIFMHIKSQRMVDYLTKIFNNDEKSFKEYFKVFMLETCMTEISNNEELRNKEFSSFRVAFLDDLEKQQESESFIND